MTNTAEVVRRVILEVAGTIATNGIQDLDKTERGGVSSFGYVRACLMATAYNALRAMPNFGHSYNSFCNAVLAQVENDRMPFHGGPGTEYSTFPKCGCTISYRCAACTQAVSA